MKFKFTPLVILLFISSCNNNETKILKETSFHEQNITEIHLDNISPEVKELKLSDLFNNFKAIPLETKAGCLINCTDIHFSKDNICCASAQSYEKSTKAKQWG